jgi:hypothetical protein
MQSKLKMLIKEFKDFYWKKIPDKVLKQEAFKQSPQIWGHLLIIMELI